MGLPYLLPALAARRCLFSCAALWDHVSRYPSPMFTPLFLPLLFPTLNSLRLKKMLGVGGLHLGKSQGDDGQKQPKVHAPRLLI